MNSNLPHVLVVPSHGPPPPSLSSFLAHHLLLGATITFAIGFILGTISFLFWRLIRARPDCLHDPMNSTITLFTQLIASSDDLSFLQTPQPDPHIPLNNIGRGGCGVVYKADLLTGNRIVPIAIKMILQPSAIDAARLSEEASNLLAHRLRQIRSEICTVGRMRHPNLLPLLAHVPRHDCHYLVYEYMKNGSLHDMLKSHSTARMALDWPARLKIAIGVAAGLEYLHILHRPRVIHRDLKPANILLDDKLNARISDFGLAKLVPDAVRMSGSMMMSTTRVAGTVGYIAPEYYQTMCCTDKCDVYSFGVILAVLVTGIFPTDRFFEGTEDVCIMGWVRRVIASEEPTAAVDPAMLGMGWEEQMVLVLKIACFCTFLDPTQRPNSRDVRCMLSQIPHGRSVGN